MKHSKLALIGSGASSIYCLQHILNHADELIKQFQNISIFEKNKHMGFGMPYNPALTDKYNLSNISSEEIPALPQTFADWLRAQDHNFLETLNVHNSPIEDYKIYSRIALGHYFHNQFNLLIKKLKAYGFEVNEYVNHQVHDIIPNSDSTFKIIANTSEYIFNRVIISTGHNISKKDKPDIGYYDSPWPIKKIIPKESTYYNFEIGILGASLSAFDVVSSLTHRHGTFHKENNRLTYTLHPKAKDFKITLHAAEGWLPHLQYEQQEPFREIYRHTTRNAILNLSKENGVLSMEDYFNTICRPALKKAFKKDKNKAMVTALENPQFSFEDFINTMSDSHDYIDCFDGMKTELPQAKASIRQNKPIHWMETLDDLMYTLNFHTELLSAEGHLFFNTIVKPFLMSVIAALPLDSAHILLALHEAKVIDLVAGKVELDNTNGNGNTAITIQTKDSATTKTYRMFVNCAGHDTVDMEHYPFKSLVKHGVLSKATAKFENKNKVPSDLQTKNKTYLKLQDAYLYIGGISVDSAYRVVNQDNQVTPNIYDISFPHIYGCRPYSYGLQACNATSAIVVQSWLSANTPKYSKISKTQITDIYESEQNL
ncbi:FAD/NAD(P)-binding protein [Formosa sp. 3Alg 14/1]|uniref:FAD/NAD(P)-binding protein n=1 Tax=Formosa sp. 3Alg 14/1 TaxID=3382190 RepID=UPI0039BEA403